MTVHTLGLHSHTPRLHELLLTAPHSQDPVNRCPLKLWVGAPQGHLDVKEEDAHMCLRVIHEGFVEEVAFGIDLRKLKEF